MPTFGTRSYRRLRTCAPELQTICEHLVNSYDITIVSGRRNEKEQERLHREGFSQKRYPATKHNSEPSQAVDIAPYIAGRIVFGNGKALGSSRKELAEIYLMAGRFLQIAHYLNIKIRWGGDWDQDGHNYDNRFNDLFHFELVK